MNPPFFQAVNVPGVQAIFGTNPMRVYPFGAAPEKSTKPYAVFQTVSGTPEFYLGNVADSDDWIVQVDVYSQNEDPSAGIAEVTNGARALRDALEQVAYILNWRGSSREKDTKLWRYSFDVAFVTAR